MAPRRRHRAGRARSADLRPAVPRELGPPRRRHQAVPVPRSRRPAVERPEPVEPAGLGWHRHPPEHRLPVADGAVLLAHRRPRRARLGRPAAVDGHDHVRRRRGRVLAVPLPLAGPAGRHRRRHRLRRLAVRARPHHRPVGAAAAVQRAPLAHRGGPQRAARRSLALGCGVRAHHGHRRLAQRQLDLLRPVRRGPLDPATRSGGSAAPRCAPASSCSRAWPASPSSPSCGG